MGTFFLYSLRCCEHIGQQPLEISQPLLYGLGARCASSRGPRFCWVTSQHLGRGGQECREFSELFMAQLSALVVAGLGYCQRIKRAIAQALRTPSTASSNSHVITMSLSFVL